MLVEGRSLEPLSDFIIADEFPLASFISPDLLDPVFGGLFLIDPVVDVSSGSVVFETGIAWEGEIGLGIPGSDVVELVLSPGGAGWTALQARMVLGAEFELTLLDLEVSLRVSEHLLSDVATGGPAQFTLTGSVRFTPDGVTFLDPVTSTLPDAEVAGTGIVVSAADVRIVTGSDGGPGYLDNPETFQGIVADEASLTLPPEWFSNADGSPVSVTADNIAVGTNGFTGGLTLDAGDPGAPGDGSFAGFPARFQSASIGFVESVIESAALSVDVRLPQFEDGAERWINLTVAIDAAGVVSAELAVPEGSDGGHVVTYVFADAVELGLDALRVENDAGVWTVWLSGAVAVLIDAADNWPALGFTDIGITGGGEILLGDDAGISLPAPVTVDFDLATLTLESFRMAKGSTQGSLAVGVNGGIQLLKGLPVGASVKGLEIEWVPGSGQPASVSLEGIGFNLAVAGSFSAAVEVGYVDSGGITEFRGAGSLAIPALDVDVSVAMLFGRDHAGGFNYYQVFADARLMPTGIPIANTGIAIYGLQGLVARNREIAWNDDLPADEKYYALFSAPPVGITDLDKWRTAEGQSALGIGIVVGTLDRGFLFSTKGLFVVAFPDVTLLLQSRTDLIAIAPELDDAAEGSIESLLVYASADRALSFDLAIGYEIPAVVSVGGHAGAFFELDDPSTWHVELGRDEPGKRMTANVLGWNEAWLFTAGMWFRMDATALDTGVRIDIDLVAEKGGFWIGAAGYATAGMYLSWAPTQWEGRAGYGLTVGAGYKKVSISFQFDGELTVTVPAPTGFDVTVEACISLLITDICKKFRFQWELPDPPPVTSPEGKRFAAPRHFTPYEDPANEGEVIDGVVSLQDVAGDGPRVELNSALTIEFDRPMVDGVGFNEGITLDDDGFITVGDESLWSIASELVQVELVRDPDGDAEVVPLWGTWALDTLEQNTRLRLFSSERFDHDGSLTTSFLSDYTIDYCYEPDTTRRCVDLRGLTPGFGWLDGHSLYGWHGTYFPDDTSDGVVLTSDSVLTLYLYGAPETVDVVLYRPWTGERTVMEGQLDAGVLTVTDSLSGDLYVIEVCWEQGHGGRSWSMTSRSGEIVTTREAWTVPAEELLLQPNSVYELRTVTETSRRAPSGTLDVPLGAVTTSHRFRTTGPPTRAGALGAMVAETVPAGGDRPVYSGYDLSVRFADEYIPSMWTAVGEALMLRIVDSSGGAVTDDQGNELLLPATAEGAVENTVTTEVWDQLVSEFRDEPCLPIAPVPPPTSGITVAYLSGSDLAGRLEPNKRYEAQVVSSADPATALFSWVFTTGRHATFTDLVATAREVRPAHVAASAPAVGAGFDAAVRALGLPTIAYVEHFTITAVLGPNRKRVQCWLFESPEPLEPGTRMSVTIAGHATTLVSNGDGTRVLVTPDTATKIDTTRLSISWDREAAGLPPRTVDGIGGAELALFKLTAEAILDGEGG